MQIFFLPFLSTLTYMLFDIIDTYTSDQKDLLKNLRKDLVVFLDSREESKKILTFLSKAAIIGIDETKHQVHLWVPNEFVLHQVKKFFKKTLKEWIHDTYNSAYSVNILVYPELMHATTHDLQLDLKKLVTPSASPSPAPRRGAGTLNVWPDGIYSGDWSALWDTRYVTPNARSSRVLDEYTQRDLEEYFWILFEKKYTFNNFVIWATNELAANAAKAIAEKPGEIYNPFFVYGDVWLGKTHLMQAIWNHIIDHHPEKVIIYLPCTKLIDRIVHAVRFNKLDTLRQKFENVDVLMIDDIQFLAGKEKTQEIFHNLFNDFVSKHKQIVITSDQSPKALTLLEARLQSRFALGLVTDIKAPDSETRIAIIQSKLQKKWASLEPDQIEIVAHSVTSNIRELEWVLNILMTKQQLLWRTLANQDVYDALETIWIHDARDAWGTIDTSTHEVPLQPTNASITSMQSTWPGPASTSAKAYDQVVKRVSTYYSIPLSDLTWKARTKDVSFARQICIYIAKTHFQRSLQKIWAYFNKKNHTSILYSLNTFKKYLSTHPDFEKTLGTFM